MIETLLHNDVAQITLANPPVNALGASLCAALIEAFSLASADPAVKAVVVTGNQRFFSAGADISEFGKASLGSGLPDLIEAIEASDKPVVAAISGAALGGGLELALSCHYRLATTGARLGLPEVTLGLLPGAGGTQRLPRLVGMKAALDMIVFGTPVDGSKALAIGLVDHLSEPSALITEAVEFARQVAVPRKTSGRPVVGESSDISRFTEAHERQLRGRNAPRACLAALRAALDLPFAEGLALERDAFRELLADEQGIALRHAFFAERSAARIADLPEGINARPIKRVGVIGCGTMGGGIAMTFASAGFPVTIVETTQDALDRGFSVIRRNYEAGVAKGRMTIEKLAATMDLISGTLDFDALAECDLVIEAAFEDMAVKKDLFKRLDAICRPGAILASNTSFLDIDEMAAVTARPEDVAGLHFFSPANVMKLLEVVRGARTAPDVVATCMEIARRIGKVAVLSGVCHGFIGNRMLLPRQENANAMLLAGATLAQVDRMHTDFGLPMGPFQMSDLAGLDLGWHRDPQRIETIRDALCAAGRLGQKSGAGLYDYDEKRRPSESRVVTDLIEDFRTRSGTVRREVGDEEILVRCFYVMINEGAKILEEGIAQRASDIDVVWIYGYGWPRITGGPMFWAERQGLDKIVAGLQKYANQLGPSFTISPLLIKRAAARRGFD